MLAGLAGGKPSKRFAPKPTTRSRMKTVDLKVRGEVLSFVGSGVVCSLDVRTEQLLEVPVSRAAEWDRYLLSGVRGRRSGAGA